MGSMMIKTCKVWTNSICNVSFRSKREVCVCVCFFVVFFSLKKKKKMKSLVPSLSLALSSIKAVSPFIKQAVKGACWQGTCTDWEAAKACKSSEKHHGRQRRGSCAQCLRNRLVLQKGKKAQRHFRRS